MRQMRCVAAALMVALLLAACGQVADIDRSVAPTALASAPISGLALVEPVIMQGSSPGSNGGNVTCADVGAYYGITLDSSSGRIDFEGGAFDAAFPAGLSVSTDGTFVSFSSTFAITAVIVKGGPSANVYYYDPAVLADTGLSAPLNPGGNIAGLSNITFCWNGTSVDEDPDPEPLVVSKVVYTKHREIWTWEINKDAVDETVVAGEDAAFVVELTPSPTSTSVFEVWGSITVFNPNDEASATLTGVSDALDGVAVDVSCGVAFPHELLAGSQLVCTYATTLDVGTTIMNVATATTSGDVPGGSGNVWVQFASHAGEVSEGIDYGTTNFCVEVLDDMGGQATYSSLAHICVDVDDLQTWFADGVTRTMDGSTHVLHYVIPTAAPAMEAAQLAAHVDVQCTSTTLENRAKVLVYGGDGYLADTASVEVLCSVGVAALE